MSAALAAGRAIAPGTRLLGADGAVGVVRHDRSVALAAMPHSGDYLYIYMPLPPNSGGYLTLLYQSVSKFYTSFLKWESNVRLHLHNDKPLTLYFVFKFKEIDRPHTSSFNHT